MCIRDSPTAATVFYILFCHHQHSTHSRIVLKPPFPWSVSLRSGSISIWLSTHRSLPFFISCVIPRSLHSSKSQFGPFFPVSIFIYIFIFCITFLIPSTVNSLLSLAFYIPHFSSISL